MSFGWTAVGTKPEVLAQLEKVSSYGNRVSDFARDAVIAAISEDDASQSHGYEYRYVVKANGHSGSGVATTLQLSIETAHVPIVHVPADEARDVDTGPQELV